MADFQLAERCRIVGCVPGASGRRIIFASALALVLMSATAVAVSGAKVLRPIEVVLGSAEFAKPDGEGWGTSKPPKIFNGGDPSGLVSHIRWASWGGATAIGYGRNAIFKPGGGYYTQLATIELRA